MTTSVFGFIFALFYLIQNKKEHAKWFLFAGFASALSAAFFATVAWTTSPIGVGAEIVIGIATWFSALFFFWKNLTVADMKVRQSGESNTNEI